MSDIIVTDVQLRGIVAEIIASTIEIHRASRSVIDESYSAPSGPPTEDEVDDFLFHNPLIDRETRDQLVYPSFIPKDAQASTEWIHEFKTHLQAWSENHSWLGADSPWTDIVPMIDPNQSELWTPSTSSQPGWLQSAPASLLVAIDLLKKGKFLSEMTWREFEELIGALLETEGWKVAVTKPSRDGGIDVRANKIDPTLGMIRSVWQAKKYGQSNKVKLREVRELSAVRDAENATKGLIVTTSRLTRDAIAWVKRDTFRLGYKEHDQIKDWIERILIGECGNST